MDRQVLRQIKQLDGQVCCRLCEQVHNFRAFAGDLAPFDRLPAQPSDGELPIIKLPAGRRSMELQANAQERPDISAGERASHDPIKRILKLRWMGMEVDAE